MLAESERDYHTRRVRDELDLAYRADRRRAITAHLRLSALHMQRLAGIDGDSGGSQPAS